ncbi:MAG: hypothetical protein A3A28_02780 [Candidatus Sungbacteria bacterium RIFCSPLOWO2_01_FULL_47_32]|uniref:Bifunctional protein FolD n=1 Tax=Candidatus Sungbacteria bacterium RIFCSPHIGHO2_01_FULL_47_32 TaxID=1802264 RepID=A0A1G2K4C8_9BACT|nr:MAG: Bifunctional protein FolD [Parcubacteria group bacterium GW2011_GWA2_47_10]OGZ94266.1 MAG: hypothetical protein A2633_05650 [Candidatus Sungbacteria bacterium RIFCSPHIGHO2_01_FULL_47_32]OGZ99735.1 MAG: hypothetical protein A3D57_02440 [Candidatus Sungbacteria bacterium RIFCSPHIGHO2_02_FULL_46_12]OHA05907.1 MAG: hypothetical protein A3A28_02780 [Candidatus Sungbacteria bacterium RIFCSPLOWO2_01_FULL_47_32]
MILLDGKTLSQKIFAEMRSELAHIPKKVRLDVVIVGDHPVVEKFVSQKNKAAESIGSDFRIHRFDARITTNELRKKIFDIAHNKTTTGLVVQLPLPENINTQYILNSVIPEKDVDMLSSRAIGNFATGRSHIVPPVVGAVRAFLKEYSLTYAGKSVVLVGSGKLVGRPIAIDLLREHATFSVVDEHTKDISEFIEHADIIISGAGKPKLITADMVKEGVIAIDAGTSESEGKLVGDIDFDGVSKKASYITPVPGGVGPVTVALLFKNLITLAKLQK